MLISLLSFGARRVRDETSQRDTIRDERANRSAAQSLGCILAPSLALVDASLESPRGDNINDGKVSSRIAAAAACAIKVCGQAQD